MKKLVLTLVLMSLVVALGCKEQPAASEEATEMESAPDYDAFNQQVAVIEALYAAHEAEDIDAMRAMMADTLKYSPPAYNGGEWVGSDVLLAAIKGYHDNFENIQWHPGIKLPDGTMENAYWSGSVFPEDSASDTPDAIRVYGTWTATHTATGKDIGVNFYSIISMNEAGKIAQVTEFFDVNGIAVQLAEE